MPLEDVKTAALNGDPKAQFILGLNYHFGGRHCTRDIGQAVQWYEMAAKQGETGAQVALALIYGNGEGIPPDLIRAYAWATIAAPKEAVASKAKDELSRGMRSSELERANKLALSLVPSRDPQSRSERRQENLQAEYDRLLKDCGLRADSLERPARWTEKIFKEVKKTDRAESPYATIKHYYPDFEGALKQFMSTGPGYLPFMKHISEDLEKAIPQLGVSLPFEVLVREFPTASFNAQAHPVKGGALILVNTGLFAFLHKAIKLMMPLMETVRIDGKGHYGGSFSKRPVLKPCGGAAGFRLTLGRSTDLGRRSRVQSDVVRSEIDSAHIGASDRMLLVWRVEILPPTYLGTPATDQVKPARHRPK